MVTILHILKYPTSALLSVLFSFTITQRFGDYWGGVALVLTFVIIMALFTSEIKEVEEGFH